MNRKQAGSDSERRGESGDRRELDEDSSGAASRDAAAALHGAVGNQAVQGARGNVGPDRARPASDGATSTAEPIETGGAPSADTDVRRRTTASGSDAREQTDADRDPADGLCSRCARRYRAGKSLDCPDCEAAIQRSADPVSPARTDGVVQSKLEVSRPNEPAARAAERVAAEVMSMNGQSADGGVVDGGEQAPARVRQSGRPDGRRMGTPRQRGRESERRQHASVRRDAPSRSSGRGLGGEAVESRLRSLRSGGQQLPESVRSFFEPRFGADLSDVRIHTGPTAARAASAIRARAFTVGRDVVFNRGEYRPGSPDGRRLLAHELTHVLQQRDGSETVSRQLGVEHYPDCTEEVTGVENPTKHLEDARNEAINLVNLAIASLQRAANGKAGNRVQSALATHFRNPNQQQIQTAISQYQAAKPRLELPNRIICNTATSAVCRGNTRGYAWRDTGPYIHLCPAAVQDEDVTATTMIHEATHIAGGTRDHSYVWQNSYSNMSAAQAVENADSYASFADAVEIEITLLN
jgi:hypothetical protein